MSDLNSSQDKQEHNVVVHLDVPTEEASTVTQEASNTKKRSLLNRMFNHPVFPGILMIFAGVAIAFQAGCNATLNRYGGRSFSSVVTFTVGALCCLLFFILDVSVFKTPLPSGRLKTAPWYAWLGGILGSFYVIINILTVPRLGAATVLSIFVCAQIIMACFIDHFALVGVAKRKTSIWRVLASLGLVGCVVVIAKF